MDRTEKAIEMASPISIKTVGIGKNRIDRIKTTPTAKMTSRPLLWIDGSAVSTVDIGRRFYQGSLIKITSENLRRTDLIQTS